MLWLCIALPQLPLEAIQACDDKRAIVVTACEGGARWVICCDPIAEYAKLKAGMNYSTALAVHPGVVMMERSVKAETAALERLAAWAYQFSGAVIIGEIAAELRHARSTCLWLEIGASLKLFGGFRHLIERFEQELQGLHYTYRLGIAPTLEGAALLARAGIRLAITTREALHQRIRELPLSLLCFEPEISHQMHLAGVRTIGLLIELPREGVARRFGPDISVYLDRLVGAAADPRPVYKLPATYEAHFEFEFEVRNTEALLFSLRRMLREFSGYLRARDTGVQRFTLTLMHREAPATTHAIGLSRPDRSSDRFFALVRERLERIEPPAPTVGIGVSADYFSEPHDLQPELLGGACRTGEDLSHTIDRIAARIGEEQVHGLKLAADHRPEASWSKASLDEKQPALRFPDRPLWLLPQPQALELSAMPQITSGPERIEHGWWEGGDVQRDYFVVRTSNGADLWVYHDLQNRNWYLHGFWS
jgi:protein ImuB